LYNTICFQLFICETFIIFNHENVNKDMARTRGGGSQSKVRARPTTLVCKGDRGGSSIVVVGALATNLAEGVPRELSHCSLLVNYSKHVALMLREGEVRL